VLKLVLQPIVENAVFHGLHPLADRQGRLSVSVAAEGNDLWIRIEDNGIGMTEDKVAELKAALEQEGQQEGSGLKTYGDDNR
jgi:two-component system sensor histidine kinase YesM